MRSEGSIFEGKTLDDAVRKGLDALGLSRAEVMITMVEEGSGGFLGIGSRPYRVRVMPRPGGAIPERAEREDREGRRRRGHGRAERPSRDRGPAGRESRSRDPRGGSRVEGREAGVRPARSQGRGPRPSVAAPARSGPEPVPAREDMDRGRPRRRRGGRERGPERGTERGPERGPERGQERGPERGLERGPARTGVEDQPLRNDSMDRGGSGRRDTMTMSGGPASSPPSENPATPGLSGTELAAEGKRWTEQLLTHMGFEATVTASAEEDRVAVIVTVQNGEDLLVGRKGEVRQALQHLLNLMINRGGSARYHLQLEINEFWQNRENELRDLAQSLANEALESGSEAVTEYLNAQERRVVHMTLKDDTRVKTYALGTGLIKRVAVAPADFPEGSKQDY